MRMQSRPSYRSGRMMTASSGSAKSTKSSETRPIQERTSSRNTSVVPDVLPIPSTLIAEQAVLGSVLIGAPFLDVAWLVSEDFFAHPAHPLIWRAMLTVAERGDVDQVTVYDELRRQGTLDAAGGATYLSGLTAGVPTSVHAVTYARAVRQTTVERQVMQAAGALEMQAARGEALHTLHQAVVTLAEQMQGDLPIAAPYCSLADGLDDYLHSLDGEASASGLRTGIADLDYLTGGLQPGNLVMVGGVTTIGKTALALQIATQVAATQPVLFLSLEMTRKELYERLIASYTGIAVPQLRRRDLSADG